MKRISVFLLTLVILLSAGCRSDNTGRIVIGSKNFTEQVVLAEMLAQLIEERTGLEVVRKTNLGGTFICHRALTGGDLDLYVEYTGTALLAILKQELLRDPDEVYRRVKAAYREQFGVEWMEPLGFNDTFAVILRAEDARRLNLTTISGLAPHARELRMGFGYEFMERADGYRGMVKAYDLEFAGPPSTMELGLQYRALKEGKLDVAVGNSTEGVIEALDLVILEDDRRYFPPYYAAPIVRQDTLERHPALREVLNDLAGQISEEEMRRMNYAVDSERRDVKKVVREFLASKGLLKKVSVE